MCTQSNFNQLRRLIAGLFLALLTLSVNAEQCWVQNIQKSDAGLRIFLKSNYRGALIGIGRKMPDGKMTVEKQTEPSEYFELRDGDTARLMVGVHDWCNLTAETRKEGVGILFNTFSRPHGMPFREESIFIIGRE